MDDDLKTNSGGGGGGIGKYLSMNGNNAKKRPLESVTASAHVRDDEDAKKKRKIGFGNFDAW